MKKPYTFCGALCSSLKVTLSCCFCNNFIRMVAGWSENHKQSGGKVWKMSPLRWPSWKVHLKFCQESLFQNKTRSFRPLFLESKPGFLPPNLPLCPKFLNNETVSHCHPKKKRSTSLARDGRGGPACVLFAGQSLQSGCRCPRCTWSKPSGQIKEISENQKFFQIEQLWKEMNIAVKMAVLYTWPNPSRIYTCFF